MSVFSSFPFVSSSARILSYALVHIVKHGGINLHAPCMPFPFMSLLSPIHCQPGMPETISHSGLISPISSILSYLQPGSNPILHHTFPYIWQYLQGGHAWASGQPYRQHT